MKILAAADIHGDSKLTKKLAEQAKRENVDLVVLCGDVLGWATETKNIIKPFKDVNKKVIMIPGNWDDPASFDALANLYKVYNLHGHTLTFEDVSLFGAGGASDSPGPGIVTERELYQKLKSAHDRVPKNTKKIMVTHMHPYKSRSEFSGIRGSRAITNAMTSFKPALLMHGHIHEGSGFEEIINGVKVINVSRVGRILEI